MSLGSIKLKPRRGEESAEELRNGVRLRGEIEWIASGESVDIRALENALGPMAESLSENHALLRFGNAVGQFEVGVLGRLEVRCGKWDEKAFDAMLGELSRIAGGLPFAADHLQGLAHDWDRCASDPILLHRFFYVRHIVLSRLGDGTDLHAALEAIVRDPHQRFVVERERVPLELATRADARMLMRVAAGAEPMARLSPTASALELAKFLHGHLPLKVDSPRAYHSVDTLENAFVKAFLWRISSIVGEVERLAAERSGGKQAAFWLSLVSDAKLVRRELQPILEHDLWKNVSPMTQLPAASSVLQRRRGYREILRHYLALRSAPVWLPLDEAHRRQLLGVKDVAVLYEIWAFYKVVEAVETVIGRPPSVAERPTPQETQLAVPRGLRVAWTNQVEVRYNLTFNRTSEPTRRSSSVMLRPDIVVRVNRGSLWETHVLDAKLRVDQLEPGEEEELGFKRDDIVKMHAYRDALESVCSACILYPGEREKFFSSSSDSSGLQGVGAIPLVPGRASTSLVEHLRRMGLGNE
jgi:predicted component of viral defense system (DUF524 family)